MWRANVRKLFIKGENKELNLKVFNGIPEAPADGEQYVRKNRFWRKLEGAIDIDNEVTEHSENAVKSSGIWTFVTGLWDSLSQWVTGTFVSQANEDKGSVAKQEHEQEYDHDAFLTSVPPIPSDISDLTDTQGIIPPHLYFDPLTITGAGTEQNPYSAIGGGGDPTVFDPTEFTGAGTALDPKTIGSIDASKILGGFSKSTRLEIANNTTNVVNLNKFGAEDIDVGVGEELIAFVEGGIDAVGVFNIYYKVEGVEAVDRERVFLTSFPNEYIYTGNAIRVLDEEDKLFRVYVRCKVTDMGVIIETFILKNWSNNKYNEWVLYKGVSQKNDMRGKKIVAIEFRTSQKFTEGTTIIAMKK